MNVFMVYPKWSDDLTIIHTRPLKIFDDKTKAQKWIDARVELEKRIIQEVLNVSDMWDGCDCSNYCMKNKARFNSKVEETFIAEEIRDRKRFTTKELKKISVCSIHLFNKTPNPWMFGSYLISTQKVY